MNLLGALQVTESKLKFAEGSEKLSYRPDIDGLRAVAITSVILFHFGLGAPGGYVGVDIFFVISGYLITKSLLLSSSAGVSGLARFAARRARRLLPVLILVCCVTVGMALMLLMPDELVAFGKSLRASLLFYSNQHFYAQAGYFDAPSLTKPLLHTWSLGVEGQFYLTFSMVIMLLRRNLLGPHQAVGATIVAVLLTLSLVYSIFLVGSDPGQAYYSLSSRAWEFLAGAMLATNVLPRPQRPTIVLGMQLTGLAMIVGAVFFYSSGTPFPGWSALLPVSGACLLIYSHSIGAAAPISRLLAAPPFVWIGKMSYSIYLWHWPLLVLMPFALGRNGGLLHTVVMILLTVGLATISYYYVERPINRWSFSPPAQRFLGTGLIIVFFVLLISAISFERSDGWPTRLPQQALSYAAAKHDIAPKADSCHTVALERVLSGDVCILGAASVTPEFMIWGDSHAHAMYGAFDRLARERGLGGRHASYAACPPVLNARIAGKSFDNCVRFNNAMLDNINASGVRHVFLLARWAVYVHGFTPNGVEHGTEPLLADDSGSTPEQLFERGLEHTLQRLAAPGRTIYLVGQIPEAQYDLPFALARSTLPLGLDADALRPRRSDIEARQVFVNQKMGLLASRYGAKVVNTLDQMCDAQACSIVNSGRSLYRDGDHLSNFGAQYFSKALGHIFDEIKREKSLSVVGETR